MNVRATIRSVPVAVGLDGCWRAAEGDEIQIEVEAPTPCAASLTGLPLPPSSIALSGSALVTRWVLPIHTWAGRAELELMSGGDRQTIEIDIAPNPRKLGLDAFREMLEELTAANRNLPFGLSPGSVAAGRADDSPALLHPAVLEHELPGLLSALQMLRRDPLTWTVRSRHMAPLRTARHVDVASARWIVRHSIALMAIDDSAESVLDSAMASVDQRHTLSTFEHPATSHIRFLVERLVRRLQRQARALAELGGSPHRSPEDHAHARHFVDRVTRAADLLERELSRPPFTLVEARPATEGAAQAVTDHPVYARVQRSARRLLDPGMTISERGALRAPLRRTHALYELLVLFRLLRAMKVELGKDWTWTDPRVQRIGAIDDFPEDTCFTAHGPGEMRVEVRVQAKFAAFREKPSLADRLSISGERRPDVIVGVFHQSKLLRWFVLDAKYRCARAAIHEGLADIHVYRDSLRWHGEPAHSAFIAVPACDDDAIVYTRPAYHAAERFGAIITSATGAGFDAILKEVAAASNYEIG